ncbi:hypothetical protein VZ95_12130 [Elstera litoralis]|uniref:Phosphonate metabolism protein n=1 Tax=Elstera litoralis TaxID=552518 RepID=A0A0F3IRF8_9PROT|nr:DUF1045 domain-containing protein [Elstera litoralis]KJV09340.1 hypothetical protein VZ95_12130 [Elstera litoralis]
MSPYRVALYWTPPEGQPLTELAARWLGRDARGRWVPPLKLGLEEAAWEAITDAPRRYGFHATLKAPFRPAAGVGLPEIERATEALAQSLSPVPLDLAVQSLGSFLALCPINPPDALSALAGRCVEALDPLRAPLTEAEIAKRGPNLSPRQADYLRRWGYPYVFNEFRLHLTLTGSLPEPARADALTRLSNAFTPHLGTPQTLSDLSLFLEAEAGAPLTLHRSFPLVQV